MLVGYGHDKDDISERYGFFNIIGDEIGFDGKSIPSIRFIYDIVFTSIFNLLKKIYIPICGSFQDTNILIFLI